MNYYEVNYGRRLISSEEKFDEFEIKFDEIYSEFEINFDEIDDALARGGKHKGFIKGAKGGKGLVLAKSNAGLSDFPKEVEACRILGGFHNYFSFQRMIDFNDLNDSISYELQRAGCLGAARVSMAENTLKLDEMLSLDLDSFLKLKGIRVSDTFCQVVHRIMKIHSLMIANNFIHGDLHSGNIKVILNQDIEVKAFDFGKSRTNVRGDELYDDLRYLFFKQAIGSGWKNGLETLKRNSWRDQNSEQMQKHYPLHKICQHMNEANIKVDRTFFRPGQIDTFLGFIGQQLISELQHASRDYRFEQNSKDEVFAKYSNKIVNIFLSEDDEMPLKISKQSIIHYVITTICKIKEYIGIGYLDTEVVKLFEMVINLVQQAINSKSVICVHSLNTIQSDLQRKINSVNGATFFINELTSDRVKILAMHRDYNLFGNSSTRSIKTLKFLLKNRLLVS